MRHWVLVGVFVILVSMFMLMIGALAGGYAADLDVCHTREDQPANWVSYEASRSDSPPWTMECTYRFEGGRTRTLLYWRPGLAVPFFLVAVALPILYALAYLRARRTTMGVTSGHRPRRP